MRARVVVRLSQDSPATGRRGDLLVGGTMNDVLLLLCLDHYIPSEESRNADCELREHAHSSRLDRVLLH